MWLLMLQLIYVLPSILVYIVTVWTVTSQWSTFKSSFFQFYIFDFVMNIFTILNTFYVLRFANYTCDTCLLAPIFRNIDEYINNAFLYAVQYHMAYIAYISIFVASLNRLTVIRNYAKCEPFWRAYSPLVMLLITLLPTPNTVWMMTYGARWIYEPLEARFLLHSPIVQGSVFVFLLPFMVVSIVVSLILNVFSMILVRRVSVQRRKFVETHFLKLIVITCGVQLVGTVLTVLLSLAPRPSLFFSIVLYATPFFSDTLTLCNPWLLLSLSKPNLLTYLKTFTTMRLPSVTCSDCLLAPLFLSFNDYLPMPFIFSIGYHMAYVQYATTTLISLNRLSVLLNFNYFEPKWRRWSWLLMLAIVTIPFANTSVALNYPAAFTYSASLDAFSLVSQMPVWHIYTLLIPFMIVAILVSLVANVASLVRVRGANLVKANRVESNFVVIASITCFIQLVGTVLSCGMLWIQTADVISCLSFAQLYVSDGLTLVQPWLLLFFSHGIRDSMKRLFGIKPKTPPTSTLFKSRSSTL